MRHADRRAPSDIHQGPRTVQPGLKTSAERAEVSGPGMRAFLTIADKWGLSEDQRLAALGRPGRSTYHGWAAKARSGAEINLPLDTLLRISAVLGIHKALRIVFVDDAVAIGWLKSPNAGLVFGGQAPIDLVTSGTQDGLMLVRRHLDAWRGGQFAAPIRGYDDTVEPITDADIVFL